MRVSGYRGVPLRPARMTPFTAAIVPESPLALRASMTTFGQSVLPACVCEPRPRRSGAAAGCSPELLQEVLVDGERALRETALHVAHVHPLLAPPHTDLHRLALAVAQLGHEARPP